MCRFSALFFVFFTLCFPLSAHCQSHQYRFFTNLSANESPLPADDISNHNSLILRFDKDIEKYRWSKKELAGKTLRSLIPAGVGIALIFISGPVACLPVAVGLAMGVRSVNESHKNKKVRSLLRGALLFLSGQDRSLNHRHQNSSKRFLSFYQDTSEMLRQKLWPQASDWQLMTYLASRLLLINHYGFLVANRFNHDESLAALKQNAFADPSGKFTATFIKDHISLLCLIMEDIFSVIKPGTLERLSFGLPHSDQL